MADRDRSRWKHLVFRLAAAGVVALTALTLMRLVGWVYPLELFSHFQVQYLVAAAVLAVILAGLGRWRWCLAAVACAVLAATAVVPYLAPRSGAAAHAVAADGSRPTLRLLLANVCARNDDYDRLIDLVREADADVVVLQEVDAAWIEALAGLRDDYPHVVREPREDCFGLVVFSRIVPADEEVLHLGGTNRPSAFLRLSVAGRPVSILATHPIHPLSAETLAGRNAQLDEVGAFVAGVDGPLVLIGDLNVTMWSPWYRRLRDRTGLTNARRGFGVVASWPTFLPPFMRIPIDHCLVSEGLDVADCRLGPAIGSDHFPLIVEVGVEEGTEGLRD